MYKLVIFVVFLIAWLYALRVLTKANLAAWKFVVGSAGLFILMIVFFRPYLTEPLSRMVAALAGVVGRLTGVFVSNFKYGVIFIGNASEYISMQIDFECSGILEIMAFLSILVFFEVYTIYERVIVGILGTLYIILANTLRIILICFIVRLAGPDSFSVAHTIIGRIFFYGFSIILYFIVFTKPQIIRQKVDGFNYGTNN